jgi:hypothetical protein
MPDEAASQSSEIPCKQCYHCTSDAEDSVDGAELGAEDTVWTRAEGSMLLSELKALQVDYVVIKPLMLCSSRLCYAKSR